MNLTNVWPAAQEGFIFQHPAAHVCLRKDGEVAGGGRGIAVFTSGGDSQGMNAAVRAVVRYEV